MDKTGQRGMSWDFGRKSCQNKTLNMVAVVILGTLVISCVRTRMHFNNVSWIIDHCSPDHDGSGGGSVRC